jgi:hypothetical protein
VRVSQKLAADVKYEVPLGLHVVELLSVAVQAVEIFTLSDQILARIHAPRNESVDDNGL